MYLRASVVVVFRTINLFSRAQDLEHLGDVINRNEAEEVRLLLNGHDPHAPRFKPIAPMPVPVRPADLRAPEKP